MTKSKVAGVVFKRQGQSEKYGAFYVFDVIFENGDMGQYLSKTQAQNVFVMGQEAEYTIEPNANPNYAGRIKPVQQGGKFPGANPQTALKVAALNCATQLVAAKIITENQMQKSYKTLLTWLNE